jgi:Leucine-rich repeat (LRR) protein
MMIRTGRLPAKGIRNWIGMLCVLFLAGCNGKIPTWDELTKGSAPSTPGQNDPSQPQPAITSPPPSQNLQPAKPRHEEVIASFRQLRPGDIDDNSIASLTSLDQGLDQVTEIDATGGRVTNEGLAGLPKLTSLRVLKLDGTKVSDAGCQQIGQLASLEELTLTGGSITDVGIEFLRGLTQLRVLWLWNTKLTEHGWELIGQLPSLEEIYIDFSSIDDESMAALCEAKTLRKVSFRGTEVSDKGLQHLARLDELVHLAVASCPVTCAQLGALKKKAKLIHLNVGGTRLNDQGVAAIAGLSTIEELDIAKLQGMTNNHFSRLLNGKKNLRYLNAGENRALTNDALKALAPLKELETIQVGEIPGINDQGLVHLTKLKKLKVLTYGGTGVTAVGIEMLRKSIPGLNQSATDLLGGRQTD